ncbi:class I SAM-dependent methyltransferase [Helicobacter sp. 11S03491-1]|uniref:class I SAM-dependent methyltransferase n=1 Tax=Helicobacter sp. 11S03491-1 TaxID=1476196 RepID=UPI000BA51468|nr:class I SAM-dependent methyltransferase [Helicobacter sp. 11S03491-1]PAF43401.1 hypothetical protein BKH45_01835 [Helicobacter sp. 11S03491-1]
MLQAIQNYWDQRSNTYAQENLIELMSEKKQKYQAIFFKYIPFDFREMRVLDIGCGPGIFSILFAMLGAKVSALDYTPAMLDHAGKNALKYGVEIDFFEGNAQELFFEESSFDIVVSRNLTWNLPDPQKAYMEWYRVLKKGGRMLNFDANWYLQLYDEEQKKSYQEDREKVAKIGIYDHAKNPYAHKMETIAKSLPLSKIRRPQWDYEVLSSLGFEIIAYDKEFYQEIWDEKEKIMFHATPMFLLVAQK